MKKSQKTHKPVQTEERLSKNQQNFAKKMQYFKAKIRLKILTE